MGLQPIKVLHGILVWNVASISLCYGTSVALATHFSSTGGILYGLYGFYHQMQSTGGSIEEAPTAFYFPGDPNAPIPFAPRASR
ncbi:unnamed protein product, partial [Ixodes pacificus]